MPALHLLPLADVLGVVPVLATDVLRRLRMIKDAAEIDALRKAGAAIDRVHARVPEFLVPGRTEADVAADIAERLSQKGIRRSRSSSSAPAPTAPTRTTSAPTGNCGPATSWSSTSADRTNRLQLGLHQDLQHRRAGPRSGASAIRCCSTRNRRRSRRSVLE